MTTETTQTVDTTAAPETAATSINLADLQNVVRVIDHACEQGAFKGWTVIEQVFSLRAKINAFVEASLPPQEEKKPKAKKAPAKVPAKADAKVAAKAKPEVKAEAKAPTKTAAKAEATKAAKPAVKKVAVKKVA